MSDPTAAVAGLAARAASAAGVDLVDVQVRGSGSRRLVRVVVDRKGGVDVERCRRVSADLSTGLDALDPFDARYRLEVSSPGVGHPLRGRRAFDRVEGRDVVVRRASAGGGPAERLRGRVRAAQADAVVLDVAGQPVRVPYGEIERATQCLPW
jgi:ribosome maturation factor RimP